MVTRRLLQICSAILYNCNLISDLPAKYINSDFCVPGLNCRYCPASVAGCPLNFMQRLFADGLAHLPLRVLCWLLLLALAFGRFICGWLCPFGLVQDILDKIPVPKIKKNEWTRRLSYLKYVFLAVFVVVVPLGYHPSVYVSQLPFRHSGGGNHIICFSVPAFLPVHLPLRGILRSV